MNHLPSFAGTFGASRKLGPSRKAALLLHTLGHADQTWLLEHLPEADRDVLKKLLSELDDLEISVDSDLLQEVIHDSAPLARKTSPSTSALNPLVTLSAAEPAAVRGVLFDEPAELIARILTLHDWPWSASLLAATGQVKRHQIELCLLRWKRARDAKQPTTADLHRHNALDEHLLRILWARLGGFAADHVAPGSVTEERLGATGRLATGLLPSMKRLKRGLIRSLAFVGFAVGR